MINKPLKTFLLVLAALAFTITASAQDGNRVPPVEGETAKIILSQIQTQVDKVQTLNATLEFDTKDDDDDKKKKKKKKKKAEAAAAGVVGVNPAWPEPPGRDIERGPLQISRGVGAYLYLERKKEKEEYVANVSSLWKHDIDDKEARLIPTNWPVIDTFLEAALRMNVFAAMEESTIKYQGTENIDGVPCWLLEGKSPSKLSMLGVEQTNLKIWTAKEDGIPRMIKVSGEDDSIIRLKDVRLNQPVDESKYQFTPPAGVKTKNILGF